MQLLTAAQWPPPLSTAWVKPVSISVLVLHLNAMCDSPSTLKGRAEFSLCVPLSQGPGITKIKSNGLNEFTVLNLQWVSQGAWAALPGYRIFPVGWNYHLECGLSFIPCFHVCCGNTGQNLQITVAGLPFHTHAISIARGVRHHSPVSTVNSKLFLRACTGRELQRLEQCLTQRSKAVDDCHAFLNHPFIPSGRLSCTLPLQLASCLQPYLTPCFRTSNFILAFPSLDCD